MATKKPAKKAAPKVKTPRKPRVAKDPLSTTPSTPRAPRDLTAPFPVKLRVEGATRAHLAALGLVLGKKARKVTRMDLRDYLLQSAAVVLAQLLNGSNAPIQTPAQASLPGITQADTSAIVGAVVDDLLD